MEHLRPLSLHKNAKKTKPILITEGALLTKNLLQESRVSESVCQSVNQSGHSISPLIQGIRTFAYSYGTHHAIPSAHDSPIAPAPITAQDLIILPTRHASQLIYGLFARVYD